MMKKPGFWITLAAISVACSVFIFWFFPRAFPIVSLDITMSRDSALTSAAAMANEYGWGPHEHVRSVASFELDSEVQTYVELEGGGAEAFMGMLDDPVYTPYSWRVRLFSEGSANETTVRYRPDGTPLGFEEKLAEDQLRPNLEQDSARDMAERVAGNDWHIDLAGHDLIESGQESKPNGRVDHTFVYERRDDQLGDARYRVRLVVSGDRVSEVMPLVRIPEAFSRRYEEMRSANTAIAAGGTVGALLYLLIGCGAGFFILLRKHALLWRPAVAFAGIVALTQILAGINAWPLSWLEYDTAIPAGDFVLQSLLPVIGLNIILGVVFAFSFLAAEGLSRLAFPHHPQFWRIWSRESAATTGVAARTALGYLSVPYMMTYVMLFYFIAGRLWGWWNPSDTLVSPDSLAHYAPWFTPFALSLQAGVWEECLFRAVPIAGAALIGQRLGRQNLFIIIAVILQALIFSAAHANYPAQPAYARLVELIIPSLFFAFLYIRFGLLPAIVMHFTFDIVLMSLPLFASENRFIWINRILVILLASLPAIVILLQRMRAGAWTGLPSSCLNGAWQPAGIEEDRKRMPAASGNIIGALPRRLTPVLLITSVITLPAAIWVRSQTQPDIASFGLTMNAAAEIAREELNSRGIELQANTRTLVSVLGSPGIQDKFVWQTAGPEAYEKLAGDWIHPPRYLVRFARFEGDVAARADERIVTVTADGSVRTVRHIIPEDAAGADLDEDQARRVALAGIETELRIPASSVREVSVDPLKQPDRTDWKFIFTDITGEPLPQGERRIMVDVAGDEVIGAVQLIHIPEDWQRQDRARSVMMTVLSGTRVMAIIAVLVCAAIAAIVAWSRRKFAVKYLLVFGLIALLSGVAFLVNNLWPNAAAQFSTAQPYGLQSIIVLALYSFLIFSVAVGFGLISGMVLTWRRSKLECHTGRLILVSVLAATAIRGIYFTSVNLFDMGIPVWPAVGGAVSLIPVLGPVAPGILAYFIYTLTMMIIFGVVERYTAGWTRYKIFACIVLVLLGVILFGSGSGDNVFSWMISGLVAGIVFTAAYWSLIRHDLSVIPIIAATFSVLDILGAVNPYPGAVIGNILRLLAVVAISVLFFRSIRNYNCAEV